MALRPWSSKEVIAAGGRECLLSLNSFYTCLQLLLEVLTREDIVVTKSLRPPDCVAMGVVRTLERLTIRLVGAFIILPWREIEPFGSCFPLLTDGCQIATLSKSY